jgi:hypothetical protein
MEWMKKKGTILSGVDGDLELACGLGLAWDKIEGA